MLPPKGSGEGSLDGRGASPKGSKVEGGGGGGGAPKGSLSIVVSVSFSWLLVFEGMTFTGGKSPKGSKGGGASCTGGASSGSDEGSLEDAGKEVGGGNDSTGKAGGSGIVELLKGSFEFLLPSSLMELLGETGVFPLGLDNLGGSCFFGFLEGGETLGLGGVILLDCLFSLVGVDGFEFLFLGVTFFIVGLFLFMTVGAFLGDG